MFDTFGNKVRIKRKPETEEKGLAYKEGEVYGQTTPLMMGFEGNLNMLFATSRTLETEIQHNLKGLQYE